jgi:uncharacterized protein (TIGR02246 family)
MIPPSAGRPIIRCVAGGDAVADVLAALEAAWNDADAAALARVFAADAVYVTRSGLVWEGRPAIEEGHAKALAGPLADTRLSLRPLHEAMAAESVMVAQVAVELTNAHSAVRAISTFVLAAKDGRWSIIAAHTTDVASLH